MASIGYAFSYDFKGPSAVTSFNLAPERAIQFFQAKGLKPTFAWQDMIAEEHLRAFTVAKMMDMDMLDTVRQAVDDAIAKGTDLAKFNEDLIPLLQANGWWGKQLVTDPLTGLPVEAQLGSAWRLETIFRTNLQAAYSVGGWEAIQRSKSAAPYLLYDAVDDHRTRPEHAQWDGLVFPVDSPWWDTHFAPNGWNCRCGTIQLSERQLKRMGKKGPDKEPDPTHYEWTNPRTGKTSLVEEGFDPGWDYNIGKHALAGVTDLLKEKIEAMPAEFAKAVNQSLTDSAGSQTRSIANRIAAAFRNSKIQRLGNIDPGLLADTREVKAAEQYILSMRPGIIDEIAQGGIRGSAALKHELVEVAALTLAGHDVFDPDHITEIRRAFAQAYTSGDPRRYIPWHLESLRAELDYAAQRLSNAGHPTYDLGQVARALYGELSQMAEEKMIIELAELGIRWPETVPQELIDALSLSQNQ